MTTSTRTARFFARTTRYPLAAVSLALFLIAGTGFGLTKLTKDTSIKAFIPPGHASVLADAKVREIFGLSDTVAIAVIATDAGTIFNESGFALVLDLTEQMAAIPNVRPDSVMSLATESAISGDGIGIAVTRYIDRYQLDAGSIAASQTRWQAMQPHQGTLVSDDGTAAIIMAEVDDPALSADTYEHLQALAASVAVSGYELHVAGPGAVSGYLSRYIDQDARKLQPLVFATVLGFVFLAFGRLRALPGPLMVIAGSVAGALGVMAWLGIPYYAITSALPVIIVAISVADAIHILSAYYQRREQFPDLSVHELVVESMAAMVRPMTLTTLTTIAGFAGIAMASIMPPITWFSLFAAVGVGLAWLFSILVLPNILVLVRPGRSRAFRSWQDDRPTVVGRTLASLGTYSPMRYRAILLVFVVVAFVAVVGASQLRIDRSQVENFAADEPIRVADEVMNRRFAGTALLDVLIETDAPEGLLQAGRMQKILRLQEYLESLPHVRKTVSIADYISELHSAVDGDMTNQPGQRRLPASDGAIAQYLFLYEVSGDAADFEEEIDVDNQAALVRVVLNAHYFSETRPVIEALQVYIDSEFNESGMTATLAGDVNVSYHWMENLRASHFSGVGLSLALVLLTSVLAFRSILAGIIGVVPVLFTVLVLYGYMGFAGIHLEPASSMFAAIALGVGVDFGIHLVDRLRTGLAKSGGDIARTIDRELPSVARACFFNSAALGLGFAVLMVSDLPTLQRFGGLISLATMTSFLIALTVIPALFALTHSQLIASRLWARSTPAILLLALLLPITPDARAEEALHIARMVAERTEGRAGTRVLDMTLTNRRQRTEQRTATIHKENGDGIRKTRITFTRPKRNQDFAFLSHDYREVGHADERWMYIPAERKVRRIPASSRGDSFFGTDFSYEDVQSELKFDLDEWNFEYLGQQRRDGRTLYRIAGVPKSSKLSRELRYGSFKALIDSASWMPVSIDFADTQGRPLKTINVLRTELIEGIWTASEILAVNHQTTHQTRFVLSNVEFFDDLPDEIFVARSLSRSIEAGGAL